MQTYEIAPDESMETLVRSLSRAVRKDKDVVLIIPAGINLFSGGGEGISKLGAIMRSYDARLQVQAADPSVVDLFRNAGLKAGPLEAGAGVASSATTLVLPPTTAPIAPLTAATVPLQYTAALTPQAASPIPQYAAPAPAQPTGLPDDINNMNFDFEEVGVAPHPLGGAPNSTAAPAANQGGGFLSKLRNRMAQPGAPVPVRLTDSQTYAPPPAGATSNATPPAPESFDFGGMGLDATLPAGLTDTTAPAAGNRVVARMPASNLDVTMPPMPSGAGMSGADPFGSESGLPSWLADPPGGASAPAAAEPFAGDAGLPSWLADPTGGNPAPPSYGDSPDWLRGVGAPAAVPSTLDSPFMMGTGAASSPATANPAGMGSAASSLATPDQPPPAVAAPMPTAAPAAAAAGNPQSPFAGLGGTSQTADSVGQAVQAAGLDARTRALLLFGMALVRLAGAEAHAAAQAARQAGCTDGELRLVVEMAQALGGGPSERLGKKILG